jgi:Fe(3+) dicitrate transport protein
LTSTPTPVRTHRIRRRVAATLLSALAAATTAAAQTAAPTTVITITSTLPARLDGVPGASAVVSAAQLQAERPYSVREALQGVPGLHVVGEDAFGLNLNIGIRGLDPRRTSRTLLLEDGMPVHLAPYSDPSAHYHPPLERVQRIEVIKGSGQIVHGPQTVGGVINFVTRPVPRRFAAEFEAAAGNRSFARLAAAVGSGDEWGGWLLSAAQREGEGTRSGQGSRIRDLSLKTEFELGLSQTLGLKLGHYRESSRFSEGGLDQARYDANPYANPFASDRFELERDALQITHRWSPSDQLTLNTQLYLQHTFRASYRQLDAVAEFEGVEDEDGVPTAELERETLRAETGDGAPPLAGCLDADGEEIDFRLPGGFEQFAASCGNQMRPRHYRTAGFEPRLTLRHGAFGLRHELVAGLRLHSERIERRRYNGITPAAREHSPGTYFRDQTDIRTRALAAYLQNTLDFGNGFSLTPGLRLERYTQRVTAVLTEEDRELNNGRRLTLRNEVLLPGLGAAWRVAASTTVFAGVHRGLAPPRPDANLSPIDPDYVPVSPELSTNTELGLRSQPLAGLSLEATLFRIAFDNQIVPGYSVGLGQTFANAGRSRHAGFEFGGRADLGRLAGRVHNPYLTLALTQVQRATFDSDQFVPVFEPGADETTVFANVRGKRLPYAPRSTWALGLGFEHAAGWDARVGITHVGRQFSDALNSITPDPNGQSGPIPAHTLVNAALNIKLPGRGLTLYVSGSNLADKRFLVSRVNGAFAGARRNVVAGLRATF